MKLMAILTITIVSMMLKSEAQDNTIHIRASLTIPSIRMLSEGRLDCYQKGHEAQMEYSFLSISNTYSQLSFYLNMTDSAGRFSHRGREVLTQQYQFMNFITPGRERIQLSIYASEVSRQFCENLTSSSVLFLSSAL